MLSVADTAYATATVRAEEGRRPPGERLFEDSPAALFAAAGEHAREATARFLDLPFFRDGIRLRTRFLDDRVREGLEAGLTQVVLLGAGFDARALRMAEIPGRGATVFEVDQTRQLDTKRAILHASGIALPPWVRHVPADFEADDLDDRLARDLADAGFRPGSGALFVWEGVIGYITTVAIDRSLRLMARLGGPGTRVAFSASREAFAPFTAAERAAAAGFDACEEFGLDEIWRRHLPGEPHAHAWVSTVGVARR